MPSSSPQPASIPPQSPPATSGLRPYLELMRLHKPVGTLLLLWPTLAALWMAAATTPAWHLIAIFSLGTLLMRSAGCVINDYADRHVDGAVERTRMRPLVTGAVKPGAALALFAGLSAAAGLLVLLLNLTTIMLACGGLGVAILYPFMKRWTHMPQAVLGAAFSWGILMAWTATSGALPAVAALMFCASVIWIIAYDTMYAMVDRADDLQVGIKSSAILFGRNDRSIIAGLQVVTIGLLIGVGLAQGYQGPYYAGLLGMCGCFVWQQRLIAERQRDNCLRAFNNNTWAGFALFAGTVIELGLG